MPYVVKHKTTNQIFSCRLVNIYDFEYYGIKSWESREEAEAEMASFLLLHGVEPVSDWELFEVEEHLLKMFNVKLNNNAGRRVYLNEQGKAESRPVPEAENEE